MRGTRIDDEHSRRLPGIIPAYAGNTSVRSPTRASYRDHPRVCGEHFRTLGQSLHCHGIIPAYAGNTVAESANRTASGDHPRVCGEHDVVGVRVIIGQGSSPRMRGTRLGLKP